MNDIMNGTASPLMFNAKGLWCKYFCSTHSIIVTDYFALPKVSHPSKTAEALSDNSYYYVK